MKKLLLIVNPVTAKQTVSPVLFDLVDLFEKGGYEIRVHITQHKDDTQETVKRLGEQFDTVVCAGGDGTLNETVSAVLELEHKPEIGYLPTGTTNDFAVSWGIPRRPLEAAARIVSSEPVPTDVNLFCGRPYIYVAAFGAFTEASYSTPQNMKQNLGWTAYILEGMKSVPNIRPVHMKIRHDGGEEEGNYLYGMLSNTRRVGGFEMKMKEDISLCDGLMELILIRKPDNNADSAKMLGAVLMQDLTSEYMTFAHTASLRFEADEPVPWTLDGENGGAVKEGEITVLPRAIRLFGPEPVRDEGKNRAKRK